VSSLRGGTGSSEPGRCPERSTLAVTLRLRRAVTLRTGAFLLLILSAWPSALWADSASVTRVLFGPEEFVHTAGPPDTVERTFTVPPSASAPLTLHLINGHPDDDDREDKNRDRERDEERDRDKEKDQDGDRDVPSCGPSAERRSREGAVSSGHILLDGVQVVSPREFSKQAEVLHKALQLAPGLHRLEILLSGAPDSHVCVTITGAMRLGKLAQARAGHTATLLADGTVLVTGGRDKDADILSSAEVWDPTTLQSTLLSAELTTPRTEHTSTLLPTRETLLSAGRDRHGVLFSSELLTREGALTALPANLQIPRAGHTATLLPDGRVLILGGVDASRLSLGEGEEFAVPSGALYDPRSGAFALLPHALHIPRHNHTATLLPTGQVLVMGGRHEDEVLGSAEVFDPATGESHLLDAHLHTARVRHTASLLNDGRVLIAGGRHRDRELDTVEVFDPATATFHRLRPSPRAPCPPH